MEISLSLIVTRASGDDIAPLRPSGYIWYPCLPRNNLVHFARSLALSSTSGWSLISTGLTKSSRVPVVRQKIMVPLDQRRVSR